MLRFPSGREILALFFSPNSVSGATKVLSDTAKHLDKVQEHHESHADAKGCLVGILRKEAAEMEHEVVEHQREAGRAANVASKLEALLS